MSKLHNARGRITYISSYAKQENLYAVYETIDRHYWTELARFNQQEFLKSGTEGKCIEAREFIIALPESFPDLYYPDKLLQHFTERFKEKYGVECISALHHNKRKTNYHIHLIFSERELLDKPLEKVATRNMFYDEKGKHCRTKKEILDDNGNLRKSCRIVKKGEVYERIPFTKKNTLFKQENFVDEVKHFYTNLINTLIEDDKEKLHVFDKNGLYLATKKIGKNNPKAELIQRDNELSMEWNMEVDKALVSEVPEAEIRQIKQEYIAERIKQSIVDFGNYPELFGRIIRTAIIELVLLTTKVLNKARELKQKLFETEHREWFEAKPKVAMEQQITENVKESVIDEPIVEKVVSTEIIEPEPVEEAKPQIPAKPEMPPEAAMYPKLKKIDAELKRQNSIIFDVERERGLLEIERSDLKGLAKITRKGELDRKIALKDEEAEVLKKGLSGIVRRYGFANVQEFYNAFRTSEDACRKYQKECAKWEDTYGENAKPKEESFSEKLQRYQKQVSEQSRSYTSSHRDRGAR